MYPNIIHVFIPRTGINLPDLLTSAYGEWVPFRLTPATLLCSRPAYRRALRTCIGDRPFPTRTERRYVLAMSSGCPPRSA